MKVIHRVTKGLLKKAISYAWQPLPIFQSLQKRMLAIGVLLTCIFFSVSFSTATGIKIPGGKKVVVESLTLINADKDEAINHLRDGMVIEQAKWEGKMFSIRANTSPGMIDRVEFDLKGPITYSRTERTRPYALFGDSPIGDYAGKKLLPGTYTLTVTPFSSSEKGIALTISFQVKASGAPGQATILWDKTFGGIPTPGSQDDRWGGDQLKSVISTGDGGYLLAGHSSSNINGDKSERCRGANDYWIVKINAQGNKLWDKTFGGDIFDELTSIVPASDGGYLLAGYSFSSVSGDRTAPGKGSEDYWIVKIDSQGNKLWDKAFGGNGVDRLSSAISVPGGGYLLGGTSQSNASGDKSQNNNGGVTDYWIVRIDDQGNKLWDKTLGGNSDDNLSSVTLTADGFLVGGSSISDISGDKSENSKGSYDFWVVKIDKQGNNVWDKTIGGTGMDLLAASILTADGGYLLAGNSRVTKIDGAGNIVWDKNYGGNLEEQFTSIASVPDGGYLLTGALFSDVSGSQFWVIKIDNQGNKVWDKIIGGSGYDFATSGVVAPDGNYLVAGFSNSNASGDKSENSKGGFDYWVVALKVPNNPAVTTLTLMNAETDQEIKELKDGDVINLTEVGKLLNIRANIPAEKITKVTFYLNGPITHHQTENISPYALFGDQQGNFDGRKFLTGTYSLTVTPYINGVKRASLTISFAVTKGGSAGEGRLQVGVFPLPASGVVSIMHEGKTEQAQMTLLDFNGNVVLTRPLSEQPVEQLDVSGLRKGLHYLKIVSPEGLQIIRIVVE